jgi:hypothetical protein
MRERLRFWIGPLVITGILIVVAFGFSAQAGQPNVVVRQADSRVCTLPATPQSGLVHCIVTGIQAPVTPKGHITVTTAPQGVIPPPTPRPAP